MFCFLSLHFGKFGCSLLLKLILVCFELVALFGSHGVINVGHHLVREESSEDLLFLLNLSLLNDGNLLGLAVHGFALDLALYSTFSLTILVLESS